MSSNSLFEKIFSRKHKKRSESDLTQTPAFVGGGSGSGSSSLPKNDTFNNNQQQAQPLSNSGSNSHSGTGTGAGAGLKPPNRNPESNLSSSPHSPNFMNASSNKNNFSYTSSSLSDSSASTLSHSSHSSSVSLDPNSNHSPFLDTISEEGSKRLSGLSFNLLSGGTTSNQNPTTSSRNSEQIDASNVMHKFHVVSFKSPTYCDYCSLMLLGLIKQGVRCEICGLNFHKKCVQNMPKICNKQLSMILANNSNSNTNNGKSPTTSTLPSFKEADSSANLQAKQAIELEHSLVRKQLTSQTQVFCDHCKLKISNQKYYQSCQDCNISVHEKCSVKVRKNCKPCSTDEMVDSMLQSPTSGAASSSFPAFSSSSDQDQSSPSIDTLSGSTSTSKVENDLKQMSIDDPDQKIDMIDEASAKEQYQSQNNIEEVEEEGADEEMEASSEVPDSTTQKAAAGGQPVNADRPHGGRFRQKSRTKSSHIGLQRLSQRVKKTSGYFWSGHMIYYTKSNTEFTTHYWKLDAKSINIYDSYRLEKKLKTIELENIKKANLCGVLPNAKDECINDQKCLFIIRTDNDDYYCGLGGNNSNSTMNILASNFYNMFKMVFLPYGGRNSENKLSIKISAPKYEEKSLKEEYSINPQELLGSGQFGQVYGGICKANNQAVAIKVIDKTRFKEAQAETSVFQNEITILYNIQHPGIVKLMALFDEVDNLYIVTEKMATDMLEMILNRQPARLTERIAKFTIFQILVALQKLHESKIAHCDLKPENILLTENIDFPQVKICDFGYAKIIGENSFRRSMVGTPAYSPPELKQRRLYNNSIDMWSMGVITYVSLSGTFPFEEDRDIYEQIMNSNFLFPSDPWDSISQTAIDLITHFLQVKMNLRASAQKAMNHKWFSEDQQLYIDLLDLEKRVNVKWLTTKEQAEKWGQAPEMQ